MRALLALGLLAAANAMCYFPWHPTCLEEPGCNCGLGALEKLANHTMMKKDPTTFQWCCSQNCAKGTLCPLNREVTSPAKPDEKDRLAYPEYCGDCCKPGANVRRRQLAASSRHLLFGVAAVAAEKMDASPPAKEDCAKYESGEAECPFACIPAGVLV